MESRAAHTHPKNTQVPPRVDSASSNHIFALFLFLFNSHYLKSVHGPGPKPFYKDKKVFMDLVHDRGSMESVQSGGPWTPGPCFVLWIQSDHRIEFSNLSFPIAHLPSGRLTCASSGEIFVADPPSSGLMNGGRQNFPPIHTSGMSLSSQAHRSSDRLYQVHKRYGGVLLRF